MKISSTKLSELIEMRLGSPLPGSEELWGARIRGSEKEEQRGNHLGERKD
jgi:hypothetical protein